MTKHISASTKDYEMGIETALIASAIIGAGTAVHGQQQQKKAATEAREAQEKAALEAEEEAKRIALATGPDGEKATIKFGTDRAPGEGLSEFLVPRVGGTTSGLGTGAQTGGLGFS